MDDIQIECRNLWKIYGARAKEAARAVREEQLSKLDVRDRFGCIVGVRDASFSVRRGEIFCIMGLSGSGKSTLVRHINRLIEPTSGEIQVGGVRVDTMDDKSLRRLRSESIGMVFQHMALWPHRNLADNVGYGLECRSVPKAKRRQVAERALAAMGLDGWSNHYPDQLSGGMQQRVGIARALAADPEILLMDEPFSALDPLIRRQLQDQFLQLSCQLQKTTIFITHDLDEAIRIGHKIAIMNDGVIVQIGSPEEIVLNPADDYVREFVKGVPKSNLIRAKTIMNTVDYPVAGQRRISQDLELGSVLNEFVDDQSPVTVVDRDGIPIGQITISAALRALRG
ncbi:MULTISPECIES: glycine betaine/L-proline ABC transporter ATP-binding protein [unclassified Sinorhizobium]|uniref:quaternary amine ABC transporter ATP-binding protein n=1 Tax=unclassified Sinorhizobium TaxID=2613772 RepID=UPI00352676D0